MIDPPPPKSRRVLVVSQRPIDYGGGGSVRWRHLAQALPRHGWDVASVSARVNPTANEASTDPRLARLAAGRARVMQTIGMMSRPISRRIGVEPEAFAPNLVWAATGRPAVRRAIDRVAPDVVWATGPPFSAIPAAVSVGRRLGLPVVAELRDLWAGNPYFDAGGTLLSRLEGPFLRHADAVVTVTPGCVDVLLDLHPELRPRLHLLPNGYDPSVVDLRSAGPPVASERHVLIHAGSLYGDRNAVTLIRALSRPRLRERVRLELVGPVDAATVAAARAAPAVLDVALHPPVSWEDAVRRTARAHICVVINSMGTGGTMALPSKLYEALAIGRPVLALTPPGSDTERLLRELGQEQGVASGDDEEQVAAAVTRLLERPPGPVPLDWLTDYNRETVAARIAQMLDQLARAPRPEPFRPATRLQA